MAQLCIQQISGDVQSGYFTCGKKCIDEMVSASYYTTILQHAYAYEVLAGTNNTIVGYYMLMFKKIVLNDYPEKISDYRELLDDCFSVHIKYIAVDKRYQGKKIGTYILGTIVKKTFELVKNWPVRLITLDSTPDNLKWYKSKGFAILNKQQEIDGDYTVEMYMDCLINPQKVDSYLESQKE